MTDLEAIEIIEGDDDSSSEDVWAAWRQLINDGTVWHLQGWYQRAAQRIIEQNLIDGLEIN